MIKLNKKGDMQSFTYVFLIMFVIAISFVLFRVIVDGIDEHGGLAGDDPQTIRAWEDLTEGLMPKLDYMFFGLIMGSYIGLIILSLFLRTSVLFWIFGFFILVIDGIISAIISNVYEEFILDSHINAMASTFTFQNHFMLNLPYYVIIFGFVLMIVLYGFSASYEG